MLACSLLTPAGAAHPSVINLDKKKRERLPASRLPCPGAPGPDDPIVSNVGGSGQAVQVCPSATLVPGYKCPRGLFMCTSGSAAGQCDAEPWATHALADCSSYCRAKIHSWTPVPPATNTSRAGLSTLVVAVAGDGSQEFVAKNVRAQPSLDFGVVLYSGSYSDWKAVMDVAKATGNRFWLKEGEVPAGGEKLANHVVANHGFIPKLWFQSQASEWVRRGEYEYVWMVDEDIAFLTHAAHAAHAAGRASPRSRRERPGVHAAAVGAGLVGEESVGLLEHDLEARVAAVREHAPTTRPRRA